MSMRILVIGATGFVGTWVTNGLIKAGHQVICGVRDITAAKQKFPQAAFLYCNFLTDTAVSDWIPRLDGIDIIINCVGIFYHSDKKIIWTLHYETPKALFLAAEKTGVKKIIHLSALGIEGYDTEYAKSKQAAETTLKSLTTPHIILKPSFIYGPGSRGGILLLRSISALPILIPVPGNGTQKFQPIYVADLMKAIVHLVEAPHSQSMSLATVSPQKLALKDILLTLRKWLGLKEGHLVSIPMNWIRKLAIVGNYIPFSTLNLDAIKMLEKGNVTTPKESKKFQEITGITPLSFKEGLNEIPSSEQDQWHAKLFFLPPVLRISLACLWLISALTSAFLYSTQASYQLLKTVGISNALQPLFLYGAAGINAILGVWLLTNYKIKLNCIVQFAFVFLYTLIITVKLPYLWLEPFGPVVKNIPILVNIFILYSMESK